ncbi:hypothetical protein Unana1_02393 [Umbelopsis nana]
MLTESLLVLEPDNYHAATHHKLLNEVGTLKVTPQHLSTWVIQDKFYTGGYLKMLEIMISRLPQKDNRDASQQKLYELLLFAHENIVREANFFANLLTRYDITSESADNMSQLTKSYKEFQQKIAEESDENLSEALVLLWAMERVFFDAWSHARSLLVNHPPTENESKHVQTIRELVANWSSQEFKQFVDECEFHVNSLPSSDPALVSKYEKVFREMLVFEQKFWNLAYE